MTDTRPPALITGASAVGRGGAFVDTDPADERAVIDLNVTATVRPAKPLLHAVVARGAGTSSVEVARAVLRQGVGRG